MRIKVVNLGQFGGSHTPLAYTDYGCPDEIQLIWYKELR